MCGGYATVSYYRGDANSESIFSSPLFGIIILCFSRPSASAPVAQGPSGVTPLLLSPSSCSKNDIGRNDFICGRSGICKRLDLQSCEIATYTHTSRSLDLCIMSSRAWVGVRNATASDADTICWGSPSVRSWLSCRSPKRPFSLLGL